VSRLASQRLGDILAAIDRAHAYRSHLADPDPVVASMAHDAVLRNLAVIGEAVRHLPEDVRARTTQVPWPAIAGLRNVVIHEYFRVDHAVIEDIVDRELVLLAEVIKRDLGKTE
jgi:uncharacterized protein with HEPN domain